MSTKVIILPPETGTVNYKDSFSPSPDMVSVAPGLLSWTALLGGRKYYCYIEYAVVADRDTVIFGQPSMSTEAGPKAILGPLQAVAESTILDQ